MPDDEGFLRAIREEPDDDLPRLVYADWLMDRGDPRGEFIRCQVERAALPRNDPRAVGWHRRETELLNQNRERWLDPLLDLLTEGRSGHAPRIIPRREEDPADFFHRGFVERLSLHARVFLGRADELGEWTVLRHLRLHGAGDHAVDLARCSQLSTVSVLQFVDYYRSPLDAEGVRHLAESPHLGRLEVLDLHRNNLGDAGLRNLAAAHWLVNLRALNLTDNGLSGRGLQPLLDSRPLPRLVRLVLGSNGLGDEGGERVASSAALTGVRALFLDRCQIGVDGLDALLYGANYFDLKELSLAWNGFGGFATHIPSSLERGPTLEALDLSWCVDDAQVPALVLDGPTLEALDLSWCGLTDRGLETLLWQSRHRRLNSLNLEGNVLTDRAAETLAHTRALPRHLILNLSNNRLTAHGRRLLEGGPGASRFAVVHFRGNPDLRE